MVLPEQDKILNGDGCDALLEQLKDPAFFLLDPDAKIISCSKNAEEITGYTAQEMYGSPFSFFFSSTSLEKEEHLHKIEYSKLHNICTCMQSFTRKDATVIEIAMRLVAMPDADNVIKNFTLSLSVILKEVGTIHNDHHLARLIDRTKDAIFSTDLYFNIISWNRAAEKLYGYTAAEVTGLPLPQVVRPQMPAEIFTIIDDSIINYGSWIGEVVHLAKDNTRLDIEESISVTKNSYDAIDGYVWICRDVSVMKKNEKELSHLARLIENTNDAIYTTSNDNKIISWNNAAEIMYGYTAEEVLRSNTDEIFQLQMTQESREGIRNEIMQKGYWKGEVTHKRKDGRLLPVLISVNTIRDKNGDVEKFLCICTDITELKNSETSLRKMQEEIHTLTQEKLDQSLKEVADYKYALDASCIVDITDENGIIKYVNDNFCRISKYSPEALIGEDCRLVNSGFHSEEFMHNMRVTISRGKIWNGEVKNKTKDGTYYWVDATIVPFMDDNGMPYQYLEIGVDITGKKEFEKVILKEKELSDSIINSLPGIFYLFGGNGKFLRWNKQFEIVTGYASHEIGVMTPDMFFKSDDKQQVDEKVHLAFKAGTADAEANVVTKSGKKIPYYLSGTLTTYDDMPCIIGSGIDISERKKNEKELLDSEQKYKMLFENNPLPMWMFTIPERNIIEVNNAAVQHYGYTRKEFLNLNLLDLRPKEDWPLFVSETETAEPGIRRAGIWRHKKKDGTIIHAEIFRDDITYKGLKVRLVLANDITEKFLTEQKLKESYDSLRNLASHLQDVREEERAVIAREIHDELGQQITGLKMDVSWVSKRIQAEDIAIQQKIKSVLQLLDETVKTIRKIATELRPSILDDLGLIDALQWYSLEFEKRFGIPVSFNTTIDDVHTAKNVAIGLFRIYQESLTNVARHAMASFVNAEITVDEGMLQLSITDNGKGFDTDLYTGKKTLGLLGMKERSIMMGGTYEISSKPGNGTIVNVSVPLQTA